MQSNVRNTPTPDGGRARRSRITERFYLVMALFVAVGALMWAVPYCSHPEGVTEASAARKPQRLAENTANALAIIAATTYKAGTPAPEPLDTKPDEGIARLHINPLGGPLGKVLRDSNYLHYGVAQLSGIEPINSDYQAWRIRRPLLRMTSCKEFFVAPMTHSYPFLVPEAADLLREIGSRFNDSLQARGGGDYRLKVTSMLRSSRTIRRLRRVNHASVDSSAHQFGTTFDISYTRFMLNRPGGVYRSQEDLKNLLAEVILQMRAEDRLYVIYESHSGCFHITNRLPGHPRIEKPAYLVEQDRQRAARRSRQAVRHRRHRR